MAKKQSTTKSETQSQGAFRQFFRAFKRRVSPARPLATQSPITANRAGVPTATPSNNKVFIDYNHSNNDVKRAEPTKPGPEKIHAPGHKSVKFQDGYNSGGGASNEKFSDFIADMKKKIKANSSFVADENRPTGIITTRRDSFNDRVSHFINRAKLKMRSTTIVAGNDYGDGKLQPYTPR